MMMVMLLQMEASKLSSLRAKTLRTHDRGTFIDKYL